MDIKQITLRCDDKAEACVFARYDCKPIMKLTDGVVGGDTNYEITIEDSYIGGDYKGFFGRIKRAWKAFTDKPVVYTGIYCEDKDKMKKFLTDCLALIND